ncbi:MAG TPA: efflux RND transporter periplasmic adaptor subunit, partial [Pirellulales bacterium]|nr:efflux RND transporter periplasmic adaptor subunit [Pirellulales bacterium]
AAEKSKPLFTVVQTNVVRIFVNVPESDAALVDVGDAVTIRVPALDGKDFSGQVARRSSALDASTRTLRTEIDVTTADGALTPGMYVHATIKLEVRDAALSLPATALRDENGETTCYCVAGGKAVRRKVETGLSDGVSVEIVSGLKSEEVVIEKNVGSLTEGQEVTVETKP